MRTKGMMVAATAMVVSTGTLAAQGRSELVAVALQGRRYQPAVCSLKGDFRSSSAATNLKTASDGADGGSKPDREKAERIIGTARTNALAAIEADPKKSAGWYYYGRSSLLLGDLAAADSAFTKAVELAPDCAEDVKAFRQTAWTLLMTPASKLSREGQADSALVLFRQAAQISRDFPQGFYNMGVIHANAGHADSAVHYFKLAQQKAGTNPQFASERSGSTLNLAAVYQQQDKHADAARELKTYLAINPNDVQAKRALAQSLRLSGAADEAAQVEAQLVASGNATSNDLMQLGVNAFAAKKYAEAADAFGKVLEKEPHNRAALFNLANVHFAAKDGPKLVAASEKLIAIDPLNEDVYKLQAEGYKAQNNVDMQVKVVEKLIAMPTILQIDSVTAIKGASGVKVFGKAIGREAQTPGGKPLPAAPVAVIFELIKLDGTVVATQEVAIPALQAGARHEIVFEAKGDGISEWRYRLK